MMMMMKLDNDQGTAVLGKDARYVVKSLPVVQIAAEAIVVAGIGVATSTSLIDYNKLWKKDEERRFPSSPPQPSLGRQLDVQCNTETKK